MKRKFTGHKMKTRHIRPNAIGEAGSHAERNGSRPCIFKFNPSMELIVTSEFCGLRHVVFVGDNLRAMPFTPFEMLCELVWAKRFAANAYLTFRDCDTASGSKENFYQLAYRLRQCLGDSSFLEFGPERYRLPFLPENIEVCPKIVEMPELNPKIVAKLRQYLAVGGLSTNVDGDASGGDGID